MTFNRERMRHHLPSGAFVVIGAAMAILVLAIVVWFGTYNIAADVPHTRPMHWFLESVRQRLIETHASGITEPGNLDSPQRLATGAGLYQEMCWGCHLGPGVEPSEMSQGLYPRPPTSQNATT